MTFDTSQTERTESVLESTHHLCLIVRSLLVKTRHMIPVGGSVSLSSVKTHRACVLVVASPSRSSSFVVYTHTLLHASERKHGEKMMATCVAQTLAVGPSAVAPKRRVALRSRNAGESGEQRRWLSHTAFFFFFFFLSFIFSPAPLSSTLWGSGWNKGG